MGKYLSALSLLSFIIVNPLLRAQAYNLGDAYTTLTTTITMYRHTSTLYIQTLKIIKKETDKCSADIRTYLQKCSSGCDSGTTSNFRNRTYSCLKSAKNSIISLNKIHISETRFNSILPQDFQYYLPEFSSEINYQIGIRDQDIKNRKRTLLGQIKIYNKILYGNKLIGKQRVLNTLCNHLLEFEYHSWSEFKPLSFYTNYMRINNYISLNSLIAKSCDFNNSEFLNFSKKSAQSWLDLQTFKNEVNLICEKKSNNPYFNEVCSKDIKNINKQDINILRMIK